MTKPTLIALLGSLCVLAACAAPAVVTEVSDTSVKVRKNYHTPDEEVVLAARKACAIYGKHEAVVSEMCADEICNMKDVLFACRPRQE